MSPNSRKNCRHCQNQTCRVLFTSYNVSNTPRPTVLQEALSFVISGIACAFAGLCYAEMASSVPIAGSAYTYAYATMGEIIAWIIGWDLILEFAVSNMAVSVGFSQHIVNLFDW